MITERRTAWKDRYEQLRQQALQSCGATLDRWGLSLLICKGLAGWMNAWRDPAASLASSGAEREKGHPPLIGLDCCWKQEATLLLANMALSHCAPTITA